MATDQIFKKTIYKSIHRGCKENDVLIGDFAKSELAKFSDDQLSIYVDFLEEDDYNIYNWLLRKEDYPKKYNYIVSAMQKFHSI